MARILIADDSKVIREMIAEAVVMAGHNIAGEAGDGDELVEKYISLQPDYAIIDITMDGLSGFEAIKVIREYNTGARLCIISALSDDATIKQAKDFGVEEYIVKPFETDQLAEMLRKTL